MYNNKLQAVLTRNNYMEKNTTAKLAIPFKSSLLFPLDVMFNQTETHISGVIYATSAIKFTV